VRAELKALEADWQANIHHLITGAAWTVGGLAVTGGTYLLAAPGGTYIVAWGAAAFGLFRVVSGVTGVARIRRHIPPRNR
jgi:hypothetical protein